MKRIRKELVPYLRASRERDLLGLNFATIETVDDMAVEIERLRK